MLPPLLLDPSLRREDQPLGIDRPGLGMVKQFAEVQEVLMRGGSLSSCFADLERGY